MRVISAYGGKCQCPGGCEITTPEFLTVDHIHNDGKEDRKRIGQTRALYTWLIANGFPKDRYRLLCYNCNMARARRKDTRCPHELMVKKGWQKGSLQIRHNKSGPVWCGRWNENGKQRGRVLAAVVDCPTETDARRLLDKYLPRSSPELLENYTVN